MKKLGAVIEIAWLVICCEIFHVATRLRRWRDL